MQDLGQNNTSDFVIERMKERPINKKKLLRRSLITASMAVMFGLIACFTFLLLEPVISNWLYPKEEHPQSENFPEDEEEMIPEEMLLNKITEDDSFSESDDFFVNQEKKKQILEVLDSYQWNVGDYVQIYSALGSFAQDMSEYMVTITAQKESSDWLDSATSSKEISGVVVGNNGVELLILSSYSNIKGADSVSVTFFDGFQTEAKIKQKYTSADIAIVSVSSGSMGERIDTVKIAPLGSSKEKKLLTTPVIALGKPTGESSSVCFGMITSEDSEANMIDASLEVLVTDIYGSVNGNGFLFNLRGQVIGMITNKKPSTDVRYMVTAFDISDLRGLISRLSNGYPVPYVGITGSPVSETVHQDGKVPLGIYVKNVDMNSPAMEAGIQPGDVLVEMNGKSINNSEDYFNTLISLENNTTINLKVMRLSVNEFKEIVYNILPGNAE